MPKPKSFVGRFHLDVEAAEADAMELEVVEQAAVEECFLADALACDGLRPYWCKPPPLLPAAPPAYILFYEESRPLLPSTCRRRPVMRGDFSEAVFSACLGL